MFVQAAVESLPDELTGVAYTIHVNFPWGSLLRAVATGDAQILHLLRRVAAIDSTLEILIGVDAVRDRTELGRLGVPELTSRYIEFELIPRYESHGFQLRDHKTLSREEWRSIETSWARRLQPNASRKVVRLIFCVNG